MPTKRFFPSAIAMAVILTWGGTLKAQSITLTIEAAQVFMTASSPTFNQANIDAFQSQYPQIKVQPVIIPDAQMTQALQIKLAAGEPSDLVIYNKVSAENELNVTRTMVDLSDEPWVARMKQTSHLRAPDGRIYGYLGGINSGGIGIVYNKDIFAKYNLAIPKTYTEFLKVCDALKANKIIPLFGPFKDAWTFQIWPTSLWGTLAAKKKPTLFDDLNSGRLKWADVPEFESDLVRANDLVKRGYFQRTILSDEYADAPQNMSSGKYAMMIMGQWFVADMYDKNPKLNLGIFPIPGYDDPSLNLVDQPQTGGVLFIPNKAKHIKEAKLFLDFMSQPDQVARDLKNPAMSFLPNFKDVPDQPKLKPIEEFLYNTYVKTGKVSTEMNAFMKVELIDLWRLYQDMLAETITPHEVLTSWDQKFGQLMKAKGFEGFAEVH